MGRIWQKQWRPTKLAAQAVWHRQQGRTDIADRFELMLTNMGRCKACGRTLTDPDSIRRGVGPGCAAKGHP